MPWVYAIYFPAHCAGVTNNMSHDSLSPAVKICRPHRRMRFSSASRKDYRLVSLISVASWIVVASLNVFFVAGAWWVICWRPHGTDVYPACFYQCCVYCCMSLCWGIQHMFCNKAQSQLQTKTLNHPWSLRQIIKTARAYNRQLRCLIEFLTGDPAAALQAGHRTCDSQVTGSSPGCRAPQWLPNNEWSNSNRDR